MDIDEDHPLINAIANKAFALCFKSVFHGKGGVQATDKEVLQMDLCLYNYMQSYQQILNTTVAHVQELNSQVPLKS